MGKMRKSQIARKAAQLVVWIDTLPDPVEERDRVALEKARKLAHAIDRETQSEGNDKQADVGWLRWAVEALGKVILDWVLRRNGQ